MEKKHFSPAAKKKSFSIPPPDDAAKGRLNFFRRQQGDVCIGKFFRAGGAGAGRSHDRIAKPGSRREPEGGGGRILKATPHVSPSKRR